MKQYNFRLDENLVEEATNLAELYDKTLSDLVREGLEKVINDKKNDVYYRLTNNIKKASKQETEEIMKELNKMSDDELKIVKKEVIHFGRKK